MKKRLLVSSIAALALICGTAIAQPSSTSSDPFVQSLVASGLGEQDATAWAATLTEAATIGARIQQEAPNRYAGQYVVDGPQRSVKIRLTGAADNLLSRYTSNPQITAEAARFSLAQLERRQGLLADSLRQDNEPYLVAIDFRSNLIRAVTQRGGRGAANLRLRSLLGDDAAITEVASVFAPAVSASGAQIRSASRNTSTPPNASWSQNASLGFAVVYNSTLRGYLTAAHFDQCKPGPGVVLVSCTPNQAATHVASGASLAFVRQSLTTDYDVELRSTTSSAIAPTNIVRYGGGAFAYTDYRITSVGAFALSQPACKQGATTFYTCGTVSNTSALVNDPASGVTGRFVLVQPNAGTTQMAAEGDSGGAVFAGGGVALGLVTGSVTDSASPYYRHMVAMPISRISGVSAAVLTVP